MRKFADFDEELDILFLKWASTYIYIYYIYVYIYIYISYIYIYIFVYIYIYIYIYLYIYIYILPWNSWDICPILVTLSRYRHGQQHVHVDILNPLLGGDFRSETIQIHHEKWGKIWVSPLETQDLPMESRWNMEFA